MSNTLSSRIVPARRGLTAGGILCVLSALSLALAACTSQPSAIDVPDQRAVASSSSSPPGEADALLVVDCLLPGRVKKLGRQLTYLTPRRPVKTSAQDCEIRGGEYVAYDRSDYATALKVWLPQAQEGDQTAQTYVGEIYEKGLGVQPDYAVAAAWYRKAAEQGHTRAQINLGHLYEKGLGVERDVVQAMRWYRQASGLSDAIALDASSIKWQASEASVEQEMQALREEADRWKRQSASLQQQLEQTRQELEGTRQELEHRRREAQIAQEQFEQARQAFDQRKQHAAARDEAELQRLAAQLQQREIDLAQKREDVAKLQQQLAGLQSEVEQQRTQVAQLKTQPQVDLAGPVIEIVEPPLVRSRGLTVATISPSLVGEKRELVGKVTAPAGLLSLSVNDRPHQLDDDRGLFRTSVMVQGEQVPVKVVAIDKQGKRASLEFALTTNHMAAEPERKAAPALNFGAYYALIIGNTQYMRWPSLNTPENDARQTAAVLEQKYGFKTRVLLDATRFDILQALNDLRKELTDKDNLLVYYAGHGHWDEKIQRGYWVPVDGDTDSNVNWIATFAITDILSSMSAMHVLVVADSCYSGALTRSALARLEAGTSEAARRHWLKVLRDKRSRTVLSSGDLQPVLDSGGGNHSVFAKAFLDALNENDEILTGQRLYDRVSARVAFAAAAELLEQNPQYAPIRFAGHESGDFIFVPRTVP
jgi:uncharacterized caspase-like protein